MVDLLLDGAAASVHDPDSALGHDGDLVVVQSDDVARVVQDSGDVGGDEELAVSEAHDEGRAPPSSDVLSRLPGVEGRHRVHALQHREARLDGLLEGGAVVLLDQVGNHLGIRL